MTNDEFKSISDLVAETEASLEISRQLHAYLVREVKELRASQPDLSASTPQAD